MNCETLEISSFEKSKFRQFPSFFSIINNFLAEYSRNKIYISLKWWLIDIFFRSSWWLITFFLFFFLKKMKKKKRKKKIAKKEIFFYLFFDYPIKMGKIHVWFQILIGSTRVTWSTLTQIKSRFLSILLYFFFVGEETVFFVNSSTFFAGFWRKYAQNRCFFTRYEAVSW